MSLPTNLNLDPGAPFSQEAEENVIGAILIDPDKFIQIASFLKPGDFFLLRHQYIFQSFFRLKESNEPIDLITLAEDLENNKVLDNIGGRAYLMQLLNMSGTSVYAEVYGRLVERTSIRRKMLVMADEIKKLAGDESLDINEIKSNAHSLFAEATTQDNKNGAWIQDILSTIYDDTEKQMQYKISKSISTGFRDLDSIFGGGFEKKSFTVIAGRPGMGKSSLVDSMIYNLLLKMIETGEYFTIFYGTTERSKEQAARRVLSIASGIMDVKIRTGRLNPQEAARFTESIGGIANCVFIDDTFSPSPLQLESKIAPLVYNDNCRLALFDGMYQAVSGIKSIDNSNNETAKYGRIAKDLKSVAMNLDIPLVTTHQLSRAPEMRSDHRPKMSDLRQSGDIEAAADNIIFVYRDVVYNPDCEMPNHTEAIVSKQRNGPTGTIGLYFEASITRFMDGTVHSTNLNDLVDSDPDDHYTKDL